MKKQKFSGTEKKIFTLNTKPMNRKIRQVKSYKKEWKLNSSPGKKIRYKKNLDFFPLDENFFPSRK